MIYKPAGCMWDPTVLFFKGRYYMLSMYRDRAESRNYGMWCAVSDDGARWEDMGCVLEEEYEIYKMFAYVRGDEVIINHGSYSRPGPGGNDTLRFYRSTDMLHWEFLSETRPDERWYNGEGRWDHMYCLAKDPARPEEGCWGYVVATPKPACRSAWGLAESDDGVRFRALPPPAVDWSQIPPIDMLEVGGCERIGGRYYFIGGFVGYPASYGYSLFTFVSDSPTGPFRPDLEAFRLCGFNPMPGRVFVQNLAAFCRGEGGELLISNAVDAGGLENVYLLPLRKAVVDEGGHLRLGYWEKNDLLKGEPIPLGEGSFTLACADDRPNPEGGAVWSPPALHCAPGALDMETLANARDFQLEDFSLLATLKGRVDLERGVVLSGRFRVRPRPGVRGGETNRRLWRPSSFSVYVGEGGRTGMAVTLEAGHPLNRHTFVEKISHAGKIKRAAVDVTGAGCATVAGVEAEAWHSFTFLYRKNMFELYVDGLLAQCFVHLGKPSGRLGFLAQNAVCEVRNLALHRMHTDNRQLTGSGRQTDGEARI